jgi:phosphatidylserine/phosphatidylglycerophosphate/cardiolipin synthase-like enzyme
MSARVTSTPAAKRKKISRPRPHWAPPVTEPEAAPVTSGGVTIYPMPDSTVKPIVAAIHGAITSIDLEIYEMNDQMSIQALIDAQKRGVQVRVMLEPHTVGSNTYKTISNQLTLAGINVKPTPPQFDSHHNVDHAKFMVIDQRTLLYGTGNLDPTGLGEGTKYNNRDFWIVDTRPQSVQEASMLFTYDWNRQSTSALQFQNLVITPDNADNAILGLIDSARTRLYVYNQELFDAALNQHVLAAKKRGADTQVIAGNPGKFFGEHGTDKNAIAIQQFKAAGIPAIELSSLYVHAKGIVADDKVYLGSQNFSTGGLQTNREFGEIFDDAQLANEVAASFAADMKNG